MNKKNGDLKLKCITVNLSDPTTFPQWEVNQKLLDATGEYEIAQQKSLDDLEAKMDAAKYTNEFK